MAVSRATQATAATNSTVNSTGIPGAPKRVSFAKIREPLGVPNLLDLQIQSFEWLTGDEAWFQRRVGLTDLVATTAGGRQRVRVLDLEERAATTLATTATPGLLDQFLA